LAAYTIVMVALIQVCSDLDCIHVCWHLQIFGIVVAFCLCNSISVHEDYWSVDIIAIYNALLLPRPQGCHIYLHRILQQRLSVAIGLVGLLAAIQVWFFDQFIKIVHLQLIGATLAATFCYAIKHQILDL
jgi:hypothetical protein